MLCGGGGAVGVGCIGDRHRAGHGVIGASDVDGDEDLGGGINTAIGGAAAVLNFEAKGGVGVAVSIGGWCIDQVADAGGSDGLVECDINTAEFESTSDGKSRNDDGLKRIGFGISEAKIRGCECIAGIFQSGDRLSGSDWSVVYRSDGDAGGDSGGESAAIVDLPRDGATGGRCGGVIGCGAEGDRTQSCLILSNGGSACDGKKAGA